MNLEQQERDRFVVQMAHRAHMPKFERAMINVLLMNVEHTRLQNARRLFEAVDLDHSGFVSAARLERYFKRHAIPTRTTTDLFSACGVVPSRNLEFDDFVLACWDPKTLDAQELNTLFLACFARLDELETGYLSRDSMRLIFPEAILEDLFRSVNPKHPTSIGNHRMIHTRFIHTAMSYETYQMNPFFLYLNFIY